MEEIIIRPLVFTDFLQWLPLWDENNLGHRDASVTSHTWERLCNPDDKQVNGLCAEIDRKIVGIVHYVVHPTTGALHPVCYMQDVYVDPEFRRKGIGRTLVQSVAKIGKKENWARMYWLTPESNDNAKAMYRNLGNKLDFAFYVLPIR